MAMPSSHVITFGQTGEIEIDLTDKEAKLITSVLSVVDEYCGNCLNYPGVLTRKEYDDIYNED
jgi:hypothetical protein